MSRTVDALKLSFFAIFFMGGGVFMLVRLRDLSLAPMPGTSSLVKLAQDTAFDLGLEPAAAPDVTEKAFKVYINLVTYRASVPMSNIDRTTKTLVSKGFRLIRDKTNERSFCKGETVIKIEIPPFSPAFGRPQITVSWGNAPSECRNL